MNNYGIILASGTGNRYGGELPKQFTKIGEKTILEHSIDAFEGVNEGVNNSENSIHKIILVIAPAYRNLAEKIIAKNNYKKIYKIVEGGELRKDSSYNGIFSIEEDEANVLIHDCARPFVSERIIKDCINALAENNAVAVGIQTTDTIWEVIDGKIKSIPDRKMLMRAQTPQCFKLSLIKKAHELAKNDNDFTDDCGLVLKYGLSDIFVVKGDNNNIKITYPEDTIWAENILKIRNHLILRP